MNLQIAADCMRIKDKYKNIVKFGFRTENMYYYLKEKILL